MKIRILGPAAGGGLPQWNCYCRNCEAARSGSPDIQARTQSSVAVSPDGRAWLLLNASPDIRTQILQTDDLSPTDKQTRSTNIGGCVLTDAEIDHTLGLFLLREGCAFGIASTPIVRRWLNKSFSLEATLSSFAPRSWRELSLNESFDCSLLSESLRGLEVRAFPVDSHKPRFVADGASESLEGSVIGLTIQDQSTGGRFVYAPCIASMHPKLLEAVKGADVVFLDGTFWSDDELIGLGISDRTSLQMGHLPVAGADGSLAAFAALPARHKVYIHINNTNPMLMRGSAEYDVVTRAGVHIGADGDTFEI